MNASALGKRLGGLRPRALRLLVAAAISVAAFATRAPAAEPPSFEQRVVEQVGHALRSVDVLLLRSLVLPQLTSPVSSSHRLFWRILQVGMNLSPKGARGASPAPSLADGAGMDLAAWERKLDRLVSSRRQRGHIRFLIDGDAFFPRFLEAVRDAKESIWVRVYIFDRDDTSVEIADLLRKRSREIDVRVLLDALGTMMAGQVPPESAMVPGFAPPPSIVPYLTRDSRVRVVTSPNPWLISDHAKTIFIDRKILFLGGMNIGHEYRHEWHDLMAEVHGPVVGTVLEDFESRWGHASLGDLGLLLAAIGQRAEPVGDESASDVELRALYTRTGASEILDAELAAIRESRRFIYVEQPYLTDDAILVELVRARHRGVDVRVIVPSGGTIMDAANVVATNLLVRNGVRVYVYPGNIHGKAAIFDGWACFGSANMDNLSLRVNQEVNLASSSPEVVADLRERLFERDFARSREILEPRPAEWDAYVLDFLAEQL